MMNELERNGRNNNSLRFLVVESSLGSRILIRSHLLELNHLVDMAWDDESVLELALMRVYDFILVDKSLNKNINCYELIERIQKNSVLNQHTPMIILTASHNEDTKAQDRATYFKKPISKKDTLQLLDFLNILKK
ncbi:MULTISPECIES: response regulator [Legionella]|uniref:Response regulator receiver n=1 Tax=Legionella waltersii TaxID=66969 RepID=A0A0W1A1M8_9GAMM|nr:MULTISPECIES: response regulator [Legionella]KTD75226.1 Response regulator receiver [Legionella waltersii]MCZ4798809.1 response regulator [Legionella pneumophila]SNU96116.1 Response regulator receiver [Legionella waltersii]